MHKKSLIFIVIMVVLPSLLVIGQEVNERTVNYNNEKQPAADLRNGFYKNPVLPGGWGDPTVVRVGDNYFLAHNNDGDLLIWQSRDLVNWKPICRHYIGGELSRIWACDLVYFNNRFHYYMPVGVFPGKPDPSTGHDYFSVWVITAERAEGPWSKPVRVDKHYNPDPFYSGIDPGFVQTPEGKKYLYLDNGFMMPLTDDGLSSAAMPLVVNSGWDYPNEWVVQGKCLESPKFCFLNGYYYQCAAMGGTSGPSTAHMATVSRSKSPEGPWEESPYNPLIHTFSESEPFWQMGHATILEGPGGDWYALFPARYAWYTGMGKQDCLLPLEWTPDGWPKVKSGVKPWDPIPMPKGENIGHGTPLSDTFDGSLGIQWNVSADVRPFIKSGGGALSIKASSDGQIRALNVRATNKSFEATVEVECSKGALAGISFSNNEGLKTDGKSISYISEEEWRVRNTAVCVPVGSKIYLRIRNYRQDLSFFSSLDGKTWTHFQNGVRAGDYVIKLFVTGQGEAKFRNFTYQGLE
ncbi:MAG: family 43 glycosylhydrolase [Bacteroidales bacterium]|nr:family 43 glycosylhydrolase [Bacteroidales bacterium]